MNACLCIDTGPVLVKPGPQTVFSVHIMQNLHEITFEVARTILKERQRRWFQQHPYYNKQGVYYLLPREDPVIIVRPRTGHCRLRHHMLTKIHIGHSAVCAHLRHISNDSTASAAELSDPPEPLNGETWVGIMEADDRQVTTVFTVQPSFHHRHSTHRISWSVTKVAYDEVRCDCTFTDDGNTSWYSVVECRWWNDDWTVKTVVTWRSSASTIPVPGLLTLQTEG